MPWSEWGWGSKVAAIVTVLVIAGIWLNSCEPEGKATFAVTPAEHEELRNGGEIASVRFSNAAHRECGRTPGGILGFLWGGPNTVRVSAIDSVGTELRWIKVDCDGGRMHG